MVTPGTRFGLTCSAKPSACSWAASGVLLGGSWGGDFSAWGGCAGRFLLCHCDGRGAGGRGYAQASCPRPAVVARCSAEFPAHAPTTVGARIPRHRHTRASMSERAFRIAARTLHGAADAIDAGPASLRRRLHQVSRTVPCRNMACHSANKAQAMTSHMCCVHSVTPERLEDGTTNNGSLDSMDDTLSGCASETDENMFSSGRPHTVHAGAAQVVAPPTFAADYATRPSPGSRKGTHSTDGERKHGRQLG